jgi:hypothetical protein
LTWKTEVIGLSDLMTPFIDLGLQTRKEHLMFSLTH